MRERSRWRVWTAAVVLLLASGAAAQTPPPPAPAAATEPAPAAPEAPAPAAPAAPGAQQSNPAETNQARTQRLARLNEAVKGLTTEANELGLFEGVQAPPVFTRPHPAVASFGPDMALDTLARMLQPFSSGEGQEYKDSYVRWHLLWVVKQGRQEDRKEIGNRIVQLIRQMPGPLTIEKRQVHYYEPQEIANRYHNLVNSANRVVGYPPFQKVVGAPESFQYMDEATAEQVRANLAEAEQLRGQFTARVDQQAVAWNERINEINYLVRNYRGELVYELLKTGDPEMAKLVMAEIDRQVRQQSGIAFDLLSYVYLAAFDGALNLYPQNVLNEMSASLQRSAQAMEGYVDYGGMTRNFADYAFHMVHMLRDGGGFIDAKPAEPARRGRR